MKKGFERIYYMGVDLGKMQDPTAMVLLEKTVLFKTELEDRKETNIIRDIKRYKLGTSYHDIVEDVYLMLQDQRLKRECELIIDVTGVGEPVREMFIKKKLFPVGIWIQGGNTVTDQGNGRWSVPRTDLLSTGLIMFKYIDFAKGLELQDELIAQLATLRDRKKPATMEEDELYRERIHDDIAWAFLLCCWWAARTFPRIPEAYEHDKPWEEDENFIKDYDPLGRNK